MHIIIHYIIHYIIRTPCKFKHVTYWYWDFDCAKGMSEALLRQCLYFFSCVRAFYAAAKVPVTLLEALRKPDGLRHCCSAC
jgi:hypothetical protein